MGIEKEVSLRLHLPFKPALSPSSHTSLRTKNVQLVYAASFSSHGLPANQFPADLAPQDFHLSLGKWKPIYKYKGVIFFG